MGLFKFFHKIKIGFARKKETGIPYITEAQRYGSLGEDEVVAALQSLLPACRIKRNIFIQTEDRNAEIDCLVLYHEKLFAIEIKRWKGRIVEENDGFAQYKKDNWNDEIHTSQHKSPFKQLSRAIYLFKREIASDAWITPIVFFLESDSVEITSKSIWFTEVSALASYIQLFGTPSRSSKSFFGRCAAADLLVDRTRARSLRCAVCDDSLRFSEAGKTFNRRNIHSLSIQHHWSYDEITVTTREGAQHLINVENGAVYALENGRRCRYALCKLDYIELAEL